MAQAYAGRSLSLKRLDGRREKDPNWFLAGKMLGVTMYTYLFAGNLRNLEGKLDYLSEQGITYLHLMPLLEMPHPDNDGGYAVEDFDQVDPALGTNGDLEYLTAAMRRRGMSLCLDFVINHTADTHLRSPGKWKRPSRTCFPRLLRAASCMWRRWGSMYVRPSIPTSGT